MRQKLGVKSDANGKSMIVAAGDQEAIASIFKQIDSLIKQNHGGIIDIDSVTGPTGATNDGLNRRASVGRLKRSKHFDSSDVI